MPAPYVLVVDRDETTREICKSVLAQVALEVQELTSPDLTISALAEREYGLILLGTDSETAGLLDEISLHYPSSDVIVLAENATVSSATHAMRLGAFDYLAKPCSSADIATTVNRWLEIRNWREDKAHLSALIRLMELGRTLTSNLEIETLFREILKQVDQTFEPDTVSVMLLERDIEKGYLVIAAHRGLSRDIPPGTRVPIEGTISGEVVTQGKPLLLLGGLEETPYANRARSKKIGSAMSVPLTFKEQYLGVLNVSRLKGRPNYTMSDARLLNVFASQIAVAVQNARLYESLREERDHIIDAQEEVRRELARDLHDGLVQLLTAMIINIDEIATLMEQGSPLANVKEELDSLRAMVRQAVRDARSLIFGLRPIVLETKGLVAALESYIEQLRDTTPGITFSLDVTPAANELPTKTQRIVFAILQEAIQNARKHASARNISITLQKEHDSLAVVVQDDGLGFDLEQIEDTYDQRYSFGLLNMRERAELIEAHWAIKTWLGKGTRVMLEIPFKQHRS
ncbi:MAG: GAF domain-containing protein [Chloroflexi bacterium]|nr:GAF domain-containing protein [Chloroflexota bacterium]